ncbi:MAG: NUDIX domain-containing protein [Sandaracinaceae bacterium]
MPSRRRAAGVLPVREVDGDPEFFLVHPGGPFFRRRDAGVWSVPKGLLEDGDVDALAAARRELAEETGFAAPAGPSVDLGEVRQKGGKVVHAWAVHAPAFDPEALRSNTFELEWPPRSGTMATFPEVDRAGWFDRAAAEVRILAAQVPFLDRALARLDPILGRW